MGPPRFALEWSIETGRLVFASHVARITVGSDILSWPESRLELDTWYVGIAYLNNAD